MKTTSNTETNAERLEQLKTSWVEEVDTYQFRQLIFEPEDIEWLIEQAERAQELESADKPRRWQNNIIKSHIKLEKENKRLREALEGAIELDSNMSEYSGITNLAYVALEGNKTNENS